MKISKWDQVKKCDHRPKLRSVKPDYYSEPYAAPGCYKLIAKCIKCGCIIKRETDPGERVRV